ncbi:RagB/SusD family nutrient uptake outer membrane protein [Chitinophaga sp. MM2321]|uniref:RagB/SusD family nutrient uptake outer membrane protein n=1 Tax=Chitinophaga sp. MM2321 TaxID=3137178 RepID=UPI0032D5A555
MKIKNIILVTISIAGLYSCSKVTEQVPLSDLTKSNFWNTQADAEAGVTAVYNQLQSLAGATLFNLTLRADEVITPDQYGYNSVSPGFLQIQQNQISPTDGIAGWSGFYGGISRANNVLAYVPPMTIAEADKNRILGEAYFLRAYFYFILTQNWGNVPIITKPYTIVSDSMNVSRNPTEQVYAQIIDDLKNAESLLPLQQATSIKTRIRATKGAAQALLSNVYLTRGYQSFAAATDFENAAAKAQEVINNPNYALVNGPDYGTLYTQKDAKEIIMAMSYDYTKGETNGLTVNFLPRGYNKVRAFAGDGNVMPTKLITNNYETGDIRASVSFLRVPDPTAYFDNEFIGQYYVAKYQGTVVQVGTTRYSDSNWLLYRLADVILMRAEALVKLDKANEAIPLVNQIRKRAGLSDLTVTAPADVAKAIQKERLYELCFEGKRWYDLLRTGMINEVRPTYIGKLLLPVPQSDVDQDPNLLPQNPGY